MPARLPLIFLALGAASQVGAVGLGLYMGARHDFALAPVHGHLLNLLVWASLALYGLAWRAWPDLGPAWSAWLHLLFASLGAAVFPFGLAAELDGRGAGLITLASLLWLAGALIFFALVVFRATAGAGRGSGAAARSR